ncbi:MAG: DnaD domain protein [Oscillospiraceae bacterium]|nr:DnaD domain protein [Oscillospiraceae bacterium]
MSIKINLGAWNSVFAVPSNVVDKHLKLASGVAVKVLLYILRHSGEDISVEQLCSALNQSKADVNDAICYWKEVGLILSDNSNLQIPTEDVKPIKTKTSPPPVLSEAGERIRIITNQPRKLSQLETNKLLENPKIAFLVEQAQVIFGNTLSPSKTSDIVSLVDYYGVEPENVLIVIEGCKILGKLNTKYIEKVLATCIENEFTTHEHFENYMNHLISAKSNENTIKSAFGITNRGFSEKQKKFIDIWFNELGYDINIIKMAYDKAIDIKDTTSFDYINGILQNWHKDGVKTEQDILNLKPPKNKTGQNKQNNKVKETSFNIKKYYDFVRQDMSKKDGGEE